MTRSQHGMVLIEVLVASAVLGIGLAGATRLTLLALNTATDTRQHTTAHSLALDALACPQAGRTDCPANDQVTVQGTRYTRQTRWQARPGLALTDVSVTVQWTPTLRVGPDTANTFSPSNPSSSADTAQISLHTSISQVPTWVGVSSP